MHARDTVRNTDAPRACPCCGQHNDGLAPHGLGMCVPDADGRRFRVLDWSFVFDQYRRIPPQKP